jgi:hypothetical protein
MVSEIIINNSCNVEIIENLVKLLASFIKTYPILLTSLSYLAAMRNNQFLNCFCLSWCQQSENILIRHMNSEENLNILKDAIELISEQAYTSFNYNPSLRLLIQFSFHDSSYFIFKSTI